MKHNGFVVYEARVVEFDEAIRFDANVRVDSVNYDVYIYAELMANFEELCIQKGCSVIEHPIGRKMRADELSEIWSTIEWMLSNIDARDRSLRYSFCGSEWNVYVNDLVD